MAKYADSNGLSHLSGLIISWVKGLFSSNVGAESTESGSAGTEKTIARGDHQHKVPSEALANGDYIAFLDGTDKKLKHSTITFDGSTTTKALTQKGTWETFTTGSHPSAATETPLVDGTAAVGTSAKYAREDHVHPTDTSRAASSHTHGNITNGGDITATAPTVASGDKLIINDESASKITNGPSFGTDTTKFLRNDGTWQAPVGTTYSDFTGASSSAAGAHGLVPAPGAGEEYSVLLGNADFVALAEAIQLATGDQTGFLYIEDANTAELDNSGTLLTSAQATKISNALTSHQTIKQDGVTGATVNRYGTCDSSSGTAAKSVYITTGTFALEAGARVTVKFTNANTASNPTLNVNGKGAKNIYHNGSQIAAAANIHLLAGICDFVYDGTRWHLVGNYIDSDSYAGASGADVVSKISTNAVARATGDASGNTFGAAASKGIGTVTDGSTGLVTGDAVYDAIQSALGTMAAALVYHGTIGASADSPTITSLPTTYSRGDVYVVKTAGTYAGKVCEVGDMIICNNDNDIAANANNADWDVIQSNIEALTNSEITTIWNNAVTANW